MMPIPRAAVVAALLTLPAAALTSGTAWAASRDEGVGTSDPDLYGLSVDWTDRSHDVVAFYRDTLGSPSDAAKLRRGVFVGAELDPPVDGVPPRDPSPSTRAGLAVGAGWARGAIIAGLLLLLAAALVLGPLVGPARAAAAPAKTKTKVAKVVKAPADFVGVTAEDVYVGSDAYQAAALARQHTIGVQVVRQVFRWPELQPLQSYFDFTATDRYVLAAARAQIRVLPVLFGEPAWASSRPAGNLARVSFPPRDNADFARFVQAVALRYGPSGTLWSEHPEVVPRPMMAYQLWNEPNLPMYWGGRVDPAGFARLMIAGTTALRAVIPGAQAITGGVPFSKLGWTPGRFLKGYLRAGGRRLGAAIGVHPYAPTVHGTVELVAKVRATLNKYKARRAPIWVTEFGWAVGGPKTKGRTVSQRRQARLIAAVFPAFARRAKSLRVRGVVYFAWRDSPPYPGRADFWGLRTGLLALNGAEKPAIRAMAKAVRRLR